MAQLTRPRLTLTRTGSSIRISVAARVVLDEVNELPLACREGCLVLACEIREWDRAGTWLRRPIQAFADLSIQGRDFNGGVTLDHTFTVTRTRSALNEDLLGHDEVVAILWLTDLTGRRPVEIDSTDSGRVNVPRR